jgi:predicted nucleotidyltransferase
MIAEITTYQEQIASLCERYGVLRLDLFGSAARGSFNATSSDLDFVALFADRMSPSYVDRYLGFAEALEALFGRSVDLVTERSIRSPLFRRAVDRDRETIYERPGSSTVEGAQPTSLAELRGIGVMSANMLRAFQVGKARTSHEGP